MTVKNITLGADPEVIVSRGGKITHAIGLIGGTKDEPRIVYDKQGNPIGAVQEDNVLYEFNIQPHDTRKGFIDNIQKMLEVGREILGQEYELTTLASHIFGDDEIKGFPDQAHVFGCEPDFFAGTGQANPKPSAPWLGLRTAGGHVHFGFDGRVVNDESNVRDLIKLCDYALALPSMMLDEDSRRRELYGKAGAYRPKVYGAEYRTLSNFWIHSKENSGFVFDQSQKLYHMLADGAHIEMFTKIPYDFVVNVINTNDRALAERMVKDLGVA